MARFFDLQGNLELNPFGSYEDISWVDKAVHNYEAGYYEGSGYAVGVTTDGLWFCKYLGHCSCYGPWESGADHTATTLDDLENYYLHIEAKPVFEAARRIFNDLTA